MQFLSVTTAAALLAAMPTAFAAKAIVHNMCKFDVHLWSVSVDHTSDRIHVPAGSNYSETYFTPHVGGVSLKLSNDESCADPITQFEYTIDSKIWYDISNVNCEGKKCPFWEHGLYMASGPGCPTRTCTAGEAPCHDAYTKFNDDYNTVACDKSHDIVLYLCQHADPHKAKPKAKPYQNQKAKPKQNQKPKPKQNQKPKNKAYARSEESAAEYGALAHGHFHRRHNHAHKRS